MYLSYSVNTIKIIDNVFILTPRLIIVTHTTHTHTHTYTHTHTQHTDRQLNPLNAKFNPICRLLTLLAHPIIHVSRISVNFVSIRVTIAAVTL